MAGPLKKKSFIASLKRKLSIKILIVKIEEKKFQTYLSCFKMGFITSKNNINRLSIIDDRIGNQVGGGSGGRMWDVFFEGGGGMLFF